MTVKELQKLYKNYKRLQEETARVESLTPDDEDAWNEAYTNEFEAWLETAKATQELTGESFETAKKMLANPNFEKLMNFNIVD